MSWQVLGSPPPAQLRGAREQAHHAAQTVAAAGETFAPHRADTGHTAMEWLAAPGALAGEVLPGAAACRLALRVADLTLLLLGEGGAPVDALALGGLTRAEADAWAADAVKRHTSGRLARALVHPGYELPPHPLGSGARFAADPGLPELSRWYADADAALRPLARATAGAGPVLCWPHHFDIATLVALETGPDGEALSTLGVGLSPGDESIGQPYWYATHWPETRRAQLPPLAAGEWFTQGFVAAVLRGDALVAAGPAAAQQALLAAWLAAAVPASRDLALEARRG